MGKFEQQEGENLGLTKDELEALEAEDEASAVAKPAAEDKGPEADRIDVKPAKDNRVSLDEEKKTETKDKEAPKDEKAAAEDKSGKTEPEKPKSDAKDEGKKSEETPPEKPVEDETPPSTDEDWSDYYAGYTMPMPSAEDVKAAKEGLQKVKQQFDDGEIDLETFLDERDKFAKVIDDERRALEIVQSTWENEQAVFLSRNKHLSESPRLMDAFTGEVNRILQGEGANWPGPKILLEARKRIDADFGRTKATSDTSKAPKDDEAAAQDALKKAKDKQAAKPVPATLREIPPADDNATDGEFEWLDRLNGAEYEEAVSKLNSEQLKRYEAQH